MILKIIDAIQYLSYSALTSKANSKFIEGVGGKPTKLLLPPPSPSRCRCPYSEECNTHVESSIFLQSCNVYQLIQSNVHKVQFMQ